MNNPFIIISTGRCGSTLLSNILNSYEGITVIQEFWSYRNNRSQLMVNDSISGENLWKELIQPMPKDLYKILLSGRIPTALNIHGRLDNVLLRTTLPILFNNSEKVLMELEKEIQKETLKEKSLLFEQIFSFIASKKSSDIWIERTGGSLRYIDQLISMWPNGKYIHIYRDGRNCAMSMAKHPTFVYGYIKRYNNSSLSKIGYDLTKGLLSKQQIKQMEHLFAIEWSRQIINANNILKSIQPDNICSVSFESLLLNPIDEISKIIKFVINSDFVNKDWLKLVKKQIKKPTCNFLDMSMNDKKKITELCSEGLDLLGYSLSALN